MNPPAHESRLQTALRRLLSRQRVAALGTLDEQGRPFVSMTPFAIDSQSNLLVIHVSLLAPHTRNLLSDPRVSVMVMQAEPPAGPVHALPRVSFQGSARRLQPDSPTWTTARDAYLARFPEVAPMTELGDFSFVGIHLDAARHVAGFGAARPLEEDELRELLRGL